MACSMCSTYREYSPVELVRGGVVGVGEFQPRDLML